MNTSFLILALGFLLLGGIFWFELNDWPLLILSVIASALCLVVHKKVMGIKKEIAPYIIIESESGLTEEGERNLAEAHQAARSIPRTTN
tara:strand:+ start:833 stop:1099 length:267 start_codon:yes stop_codon:yes gene_type:complete